MIVISENQSDLKLMMNSEINYKYIYIIMKNLPNKNLSKMIVLNCKNNILKNNIKFFKKFNKINWKTLNKMILKRKIIIFKKSILNNFKFLLIIILYLKANFKIEIINFTYMKNLFIDFNFGKIYILCIFI